MHRPNAPWTAPAVPVAIASILAVATMVGCASRQDHTQLLRSIATTELRLQPKITRVPELSLRVPSGYSIDWTENASHDEFIIYDPADKGDVQRGMLVVNVTAAPVLHIPDSVSVRHVRSKLEDRTIEWRIGPPESTGVQIYRREAIVRDLFPFFKDPASGRELSLQVFVVGTDSVLVEQLMGSAETIRQLRGKPDA